MRFAKKCIGIKSNIMKKNIYKQIKKKIIKYNI